MTHCIQLRGPWEFSISGTDVAGRIEFPCDWAALPAVEAATIRFRRFFHLPTGLEPEDRVLLVLRCQSAAVAHLNGASLALEAQRDGSHQADVTRRLAPRNELTIDLVPPYPALLNSHDPIVEAALQIDPN